MMIEREVEKYEKKERGEDAVLLLCSMIQRTEQPRPVSEVQDDT